MIAKKHEHETTSVLAVCDKEHLGKTYEDGKLFFNVSERFFSGEEIGENELIELIKEVDSINFFGNKCVEIAQKEGLISESNVNTIKGFKHAQVYKI